MSIFEFRKPAAGESHRDTLLTLRETIQRLEAEPQQTPQTATLKRILAVRIQELESKTA